MRDFQQVLQTNLRYLLNFLVVVVMTEVLYVPTTQYHFWLRFPDEEARQIFYSSFDKSNPQPDQPVVQQRIVADDVDVKQADQATLPDSGSDLSEAASMVCPAPDFAVFSTLLVSRSSLDYAVLCSTLVPVLLWIMLNFAQSLQLFYSGSRHISSCSSRIMQHPDIVCRWVYGNSISLSRISARPSSPCISASICSAMMPNSHRDLTKDVLVC